MRSCSTTTSESPISTALFTSSSRINELIDDGSRNSVRTNRCESVNSCAVFDDRNILSSFAAELLTKRKIRPFLDRSWPAGSRNEVAIESKQIRAKRIYLGATLTCTIPVEIPAYPH